MSSHPRSCSPAMGMAGRLRVAALFLLPSMASGQTTFEQAVELHLAGDSPAAIRAYEEVAATQQQSEPAVAAAALNNACVLYLGLADYPRAVERCRSALELRRQLADDARTARALNNLALAQQNLGAWEEAAAAYTEAIEINTRLEETESRVQNLGNLGVLQTLTGRFGEALRSHTEAFDLATSHAGDAWAAEQQAVALMNQGVVFERIGDYARALELYRQALAMNRLQDARQRAHLHLNLAVAYRNLGDPAVALAELERATSLFTEIGDRSGIAQAELNRALVLHWSLERPATEAFRAARRLARELADRPLEIEVLLHQGQALLDMEDLVETEAAFRQCLELAEASGSAEGRWSALAGLAEIEVRRGELEHATVRLRRAVEEIEGARSDLPILAMRERFFTPKIDVYRLAVRVEMDLHRRDPDVGHDRIAFDLVQQAKARGLLDALGRSGGVFEPLGIDALQQRLEDDLLLDFFQTGSELLVWEVSATEFAWRAVAPAEGVREQVLTTWRLLAEGSSPPETQLLDLSRLLLPGSLAHQQGKRLWISPDSFLRYLPFEILPFPEANDRLLVDSLRIAYLPNASALGIDFDLPSNPEPAVVALADPDRSAWDANPRSLAAEMAARYALPPLTASRREIETLARWLPAPQVALVGESATEGALVEAIQRGSRIVHLAAHTVIDERIGAGTAVFLAADAAHDGLLRPQEIAQRRAEIGLTVLAACRTAIDPSAELGALTTLTGAWLAAGSRAVVATLWDVGDEATAAFMEQFYFQIADGRSASEALQLAKKRLLNDPHWNHPALWSGYVLVGDVRPFPSRPAWWRWAAGGLSLLAFVIWLRQRRS